MRFLHQTALDDALEAFLPHAKHLAGAAVYINGASGFLASNLLLFLSELNLREGLCMRLFASARRPMDRVDLFHFMGRFPDAAWEVASAQQAAIPQVDGLIAVHTASYGSPVDYLREPAETLDVNIKGMSRMFEGPRLPGHVVYLSSAEIYGQPPAAATPTPETFVGGTDLATPRCIYAESKRVTEALGVTLATRDRVPLTILRPWSVYGPGQRLEDGRIPVEFLRQALSDGRIRLQGDGTPTRSMCYAWDGIVQMASTLCPGSAPVRVFNIGSSACESSVAEIAHACAKAAGLAPSAVSLGQKTGNAGPVRSLANIDRVAAHVGMRPSISLDHGLHASAQWCQYLFAKNGAAA